MTGECEVFYMNLIPPEIWSGIIGILGAVVGWFLNMISNNRRCKIDIEEAHVFGFRNINTKSFVPIDSGAEMLQVDFNVRFLNNKVRTYGVDRCYIGFYRPKEQPDKLGKITLTKLRQRAKEILRFKLPRNFVELENYGYMEYTASKRIIEFDKLINVPAHHMVVARYSSYFPAKWVKAGYKVYLVYQFSGSKFIHKRLIREVE